MISPKTTTLIENEFGWFVNSVPRGAPGDEPDVPVPSTELVAALSADAARMGVRQTVDWAVLLFKIIPLIKEHGPAIASIIADFAAVLHMGTMSAHPDLETLENVDPDADD